MRYADDGALIRDPERKPQLLLNKLLKESEKEGLTFNCKKTEI